MSAPASIAWPTSTSTAGSEPPIDEHADALAPLSDAETDARLRAADERGSDRAGQPSMPGPAQLRELFAELEISAQDDGGVQIHASPRAAQTLGALFAGMAELLADAGARDDQGE